MLTGGGSYVYNGYVRDEASGDTTRTLNLQPASYGTLTLVGGEIDYTGTTTLSGGQLTLFNTAAYDSPTTVNSGATMAWSGNANVNACNTDYTIALNNGATLSNLNPSNWTVIAAAVTASGSTTINQSSNATSSAGEGFYLDGGLNGTGICTINAPNAGSGVNLRYGHSAFSGSLVVNGIASATPFSGSGIGVGGCGTGLQNADITLNGTMELQDQGIGWANAAWYAFSMGALSGTGAMVANTSDGPITTVTMGNTNHSGTFSGTIANAGTSINLVKAGSGTETLTGTNAYSGTTTVNGGTLAVASGSLDGGCYASAIVNNATLQFSGSGTQNLFGAITNNATLQFSGSGTQDLFGAISGGGTVLKDGSGTLVLATTGSVASTQSFTLNAGTLDIAAGPGGRTLANSFVLNGGTVLAAQDDIGSGGAIAVDGTNVTHAFTGSGTLVLPDRRRHWRVACSWSAAAAAAPAARAAPYMAPAGAVAKSAA